MGFAQLFRFLLLYMRTIYTIFCIAREEVIHIILLGFCQPQNIAVASHPHAGTDTEAGHSSVDFRSGCISSPCGDGYLGGSQLVICLVKVASHPFAGTNTSRPWCMSRSLRLVSSHPFAGTDMNLCNSKFPKSSVCISSPCGDEH